MFADVPKFVKFIIVPNYIYNSHNILTTGIIQFYTVRSIIRTTG